MSGENIKQRIVAAVLFLVLGGVALAYAFSQLVGTKTGWQAIEASSATEANCGGEFTFFYEIGAGERSAAAERNAVAALYSEACRKLFQLFHTMESFEGITNLRDISLHPNETLTVEPELYRAFETVQRCGDRTVYLGPVCARYFNLFNCQDDGQLLDFDPWSNPQVAEEYAAIAAYAADPAHIDVELLGENQVRLRVSEEYLVYARQEEIERFLDFGWMTNAFVADCLADTLVQAGYTHGMLSSCDGFARCLDGREISFSLDLYGWEGGRPIIAGTMEYQGPMSVVSLCSFPVTEQDWQRFYQLRDGQLRTPYLDVSDGRSRTAADVDCMVCYAPTRSCAELAMGAASAYISDSFREEAVRELAQAGTQVIWCRERTFYASDPGLAVAGLYEGYALETAFQP